MVDEWSLEDALEVRREEGLEKGQGKHELPSRPIFSKTIEDNEGARLKSGRLLRYAKNMIPSENE